MPLRFNSRRRKNPHCHVSGSGTAVCQAGTESAGSDSFLMGEIRRMILEKETIHTMVYKLLLAAAAVYWCVFLRRSDARIEPYLLIAILALAGSVCVPTKKTVRE